MNCKVMLRKYRYYDIPCINDANNEYTYYSDDSYNSHYANYSDDTYSTTNHHNSSSNYDDYQWSYISQTRYE